MAQVCPMSGCKATKGPCIHDKMMLIMAVMIAAAAAAHWGLHVI